MQRVLLVDDSASIRYLVRLVLEVDGRFRVVGEAGDGAEAIALATELDPDMVLLDLSMPGMNGMDALPQIRSAVPEARVAVFTSVLDEGVMERAYAAGAWKVLYKGLNGTNLCRELHEAARVSRVRADHAPVVATRGPRPQTLLRSRRVRPRRQRVWVAVASILLLVASFAVALVLPAPTSIPVHALEHEDRFSQALFHEVLLEAEPAGGPVSRALGGGEAQPYTVVVPSMELRWTVEPDGGVTMVTKGPVSWPAARDAFARWFEEKEGVVPSFEDLQVIFVQDEAFPSDAVRS